MSTEKPRDYVLIVSCPDAVAADSLAFGNEGFEERFAPLARTHDTEVRDSAVPRRVMCLLSRQEEPGAAPQHGACRSPRPVLGSQAPSTPR